MAVLEIQYFWAHKHFEFPFLGYCWCSILDTVLVYRIMKKAVVLGAGLAGLTIATELADKGYEVLVLEKNKYLGGRASNITDPKTEDPVPIGPHIFIRGYNNFKRFLHKIGAHQSIVWERNLFLELVYNQEHYQFRMADIPTSLLSLPKMLKYPFLKIGDKFSNLRIGLGLYFSSKEGFESIDDISAYGGYPFLRTPFLNFGYARLMVSMIVA